MYCQYHYQRKTISTKSPLRFWIQFERQKQNSLERFGYEKTQILFYRKNCASSNCTRTHAASDYQHTCHISDMVHKRYSRIVSVISVQALSQRIPYPRRKTYNRLVRAISSLTKSLLLVWFHSRSYFFSQFRVPLSIPCTSLNYPLANVSPTWWSYARP